MTIITNLSFFSADYPSKRMTRKSQLQEAREGVDEADGGGSAEAELGHFGRPETNVHVTS